MEAPSSAPLPESVAPDARAAAGWQGWWRLAENSLVVAALAVMVTLPVLEIVLRRFFHTGLTSSVPIVQHLVLVVGMLGGALAARDDRLLALSVAPQFLRGRAKAWARIFSHGFATAVCVFLAQSSVQLVEAKRALHEELAYGIPLWVVLCLMVLGFAVIAGRLAWHAAKNWRGRGASLVLALALILVALYPPVAPERLFWPFIVLLVAAIACGAPVFTALGGAALAMLWSQDESVGAVAIKHYSLTVNPTLPSIPLFTLAGYMLAEGGAAARLVRVFEALFGSLRGGPAIVTTLTCAFFTSFTGASGATILALGGVLMPVLLAARYSERSALGLLTGAGSLGMLFPPCLPPILYSIIASSGGATTVSMEDMFKGGLLPGLLLLGMTACWGILVAPKRTGDQIQPFNARDAATAVWQAKWELLVPVVALTALFSGLASPVEAAAVTAFYTFLTVTVIHRDLKIGRDVPRVMAECGLLVGGVLLILGVALGFTNTLILAQVPDQAVAWATGAIHSKWIFLLALNVVLLIVGGLVEIYAAIIVVVPLLVPLGLAFDIDPIHLGIIFLANMELGFLAPPVGLNLLLASYRFGKPMGEVTRASLPMLGVMIIGVLLITYVPWLTTWLPSVWH